MDATLDCRPDQCPRIKEALLLAPHRSMHKVRRMLAALRRDSTSVSNSAQNKCQLLDIISTKRQNAETKDRSLAHRQSDSICCERASAASSSREVTTALTVANSSRGLLERGRNTPGHRVLALPVPQHGGNTGIKATMAGGCPIPLSQHAHAGTPGRVIVLHDDG
jgi:hypothetical protein